MHDETFTRFGTSRAVFLRACCGLALCALAACGKSSPDAQPQSPVATHGAASEPAAATPARPAAKDAVAATPPAAVIGSGVLSYPDNLQVELLADRIMGRTPPFDEWAAAWSRATATLETIP